MNFSSVLFVFCFLPIILLLYYFIPGRRGKDIVLLCASLIFYAAGQPVYLILMLFSMLFNYFMAMDLNANPDQAKKTASLVFTIVVNLFILGFFKYYGFLLDSLGIDFRKNFDYPYTSRSVTEFWRRWHITLGSWFRDYVYIPLGGNRVTLSLHVRNIIIVWALTGLWHGASWNFVLWGIYYGLLLLFEKYFIDRMHYGLPGWFRCILTIFAVMIGWAFFSQSGFGDSFRFIGNLFGIGASGAADVTALYFLKENLILILLGCITSTPYPQMLHQKLRTRSPHAAAAAVIILLMISVACMVAGSYKPFMYQQF